MSRNPTVTLWGVTSFGRSFYFERTEAEARPSTYKAEKSLPSYGYSTIVAKDAADLDPASAATRQINKRLTKIEQMHKEIARLDAEIDAIRALPLPTPEKP